ncbi:MAG: hypothetical protein WD793_14345 [Steroidobacteraceae bacterium]
MTETRDRRRLELLPIELALIVALFWADEQGWIPLSKTPFLFLVAWGSMRLRGVGWRDGRNLVVPIIAHGIGNSIDFTVMYLGHYPGVGS